MVGRNNWLFFHSDVGGRTAAALRSFVASCQRVGIDPFAWFKDVLSRISNHPSNRIPRASASSLGCGQALIKSLVLRSEKLLGTAIQKT